MHFAYMYMYSYGVLSCMRYRQDCDGSEFMHTVDTV